MKQMESKTTLVKILHDKGEKTVETNMDRLSIILSSPKRNRKKELLREKNSTSFNDPDVIMILDGMGDIESWQDMRSFVKFNTQASQ